MTARLIDLLSLANTWAQPQTFEGQAFLKGGASLYDARVQSFLLRLQNGLNRFGIQLADDATEDFVLRRYDDSGVLIGNALRVDRASGAVICPVGVISGGENVWRNGFASLSGGNPGAIRFPNGAMFQVGQASLSAAQVLDVTLWQAFSLVHLIAIGSVGSGAGGWAADTNLDVSAYPLSLSQVRLVNGDPSNAATINWLSVGF